MNDGPLGVCGMGNRAFGGPADDLACLCRAPEGCGITGSPSIGSFLPSYDNLHTDRTPETCPPAGIVTNGVLVEKPWPSIACDIGNGNKILPPILGWIAAWQPVWYACKSLGSASRLSDDFCSQQTTKGPGCILGCMCKGTATCDAGAGGDAAVTDSAGGRDVSSVAVSSSGDEARRRTGTGHNKPSVVQRSLLVQVSRVISYQIAGSQPVASVRGFSSPQASMEGLYPYVRSRRAHRESNQPRLQPGEAFPECQLRFIDPSGKDRFLLLAITSIPAPPATLVRHERCCRYCQFSTDLSGALGFA